MLNQSPEELGWTPTEGYSDLGEALKEDKDILHVDIPQKRLEELLVNNAVVKSLQEKRKSDLDVSKMLHDEALRGVARGGILKRSFRALFSGTENS